MSKFIITINRSCGSGGSIIGRIIAKRLGAKFYDNELIDLASDESGISKQLFAQADERVKNNLYTRMTKNIYDGQLITPDSEDFTSFQNLFNYQAKIIKDVADKDSCIIIGRCADFVLKDRENLVRVFVGASEDVCVATETERLGLTVKEAKDRINKMDMYRAAYYRYYTGQQWNNALNYDVCVNTSVLSYEECADVVVAFLEKVMAKNAE